MWRSFFLALGLFSLLLGVQCLFIDRAHWAGDGSEVVPPDWAPWTMMSVGAVVMLYSYTLPKKLKA